MPNLAHHLGPAAAPPVPLDGPIVAEPAQPSGKPSQVVPLTRRAGAGHSEQHVDGGAVASSGPTA
jgi:hypothetical protein